MCPEVLHIYGSISIQSFGLCAAVGISVFSWLVLRHPARPAIIAQNQFIESLWVGVLAALIGARALHVVMWWHTMESWVDIVALWDGGLSLLGGFIALLIVMPWYFKRHAIPVWPLADLASLYAPLLQAIARVGCFFAGCCYGLPSTAAWAIAFPLAGNTIESLCQRVHPTQLYSSFLLLMVYGVLVTLGNRIATHHGQMFMLYLFLISVERFVTDFWRGDREFVLGMYTLSVHQCIAVFIMVGAGVSFLIMRQISEKRRYSL